MKKLLLWLTLPPIAAIMVAFAIANRQGAKLSFDPLPFVMEVPLYAVVFCAIFIGLVAGGWMTWVGQSKGRRRARQNRRDLGRLAGEIDGLRADAANDVGSEPVAGTKAVATRP